nr:Gfo/Idh/MocA family oxidoreductase [Candidatus Sigynarchaeota archaeon]
SAIVPSEKAAIAYHLLQRDPDHALAVVLDFTHEKTKVRNHETETGPAKQQVTIGLIGCGAFAQANHLPFLAALDSVRLKAIATRSTASAESCKNKYHPEYTSTDYKHLLSDNDIGLIFIYTRHGDHARQAIESMKAGKNVFCEKPMGITLDECIAVCKVAKDTGRSYMTGFNRRMSPLVLKARELLQNRNNPIIINYRVASPYVPADNWIYDRKEGGGRIIGECCHFYDLILFLMKSDPVEIVARGGQLSNRDVDFIDNFMSILKFKDDSIATLTYSDLSSKDMPKERIEIFTGMSAIIIDDFQAIETGGFGCGSMALPYQDKGHKNEMANVIESTLQLKAPFVNEIDALKAMKLCFYTEQSVRNNSTIPIQGLGDIDT